MSRKLYKVTRLQNPNEYTDNAYYYPEGEEHKLANFMFDDDYKIEMAEVEFKPVVFAPEYKE